MKVIDQTQWKRKSHFDFFSQMDCPHFNVCFDVEITATHAFAREQGLKIFNVLLFLSTMAANQIPEFRTRIREHEIVEHAVIHPAHTILNSNNTLNFCATHFTPSAPQFFADIAATTRELATKDYLVLEEHMPDDRIYITSLPWIKFTSFQHPVQISATDSIPRIAWGKFTQTGDRWEMPYSIQVHHGLADGYHTGMFYETLQEMLHAPEAYVSTTSD